MFFPSFFFVEKVSCPHGKTTVQKPMKSYPMLSPSLSIKTLFRIIRLFLVSWVNLKMNY